MFIDKLLNGSSFIKAFQKPSLGDRRNVARKKIMLLKG